MQDLAQKVAMHVVGAQPRYLNRQQVPEKALASEKALLTEQALKSGRQDPLWVGTGYQTAFGMHSIIGASSQLHFRAASSQLEEVRVPSHPWMHYLLSFCLLGGIGTIECSLLPVV